MSPTEGSPSLPEASGPQCVLCGRLTFDPDKRDRPWVRGVSAGEQVLVCPICQEERPDWAQALDRCGRCEGTRLSAVLGQVVCRTCGHAKVADIEHEDEGA